MSGPFATPQRAPVRPRVTVPAGTVPRLLEEEVAALLAADARAAVELTGPQWTGRTTALAHLAATFAAEPRLGLVDTDGARWGGDVVVVSARDRPHGERGSVHFELAPWTDDDVLEYLLAAHRADVARGYAAWQLETADHGLGRFPGLCRAVLDALAAGRAADVLDALERCIDEALDGQPAAVRTGLVRHCTPDRASTLASPRPGVPMLGAPIVRALLAAAELVATALAGEALPLESIWWSPHLLAAVRREAFRHPDRMRALRAAGERTDQPAFAGVLTLLCVAQPGFRPATAAGTLSWARLAGADLRGLALAGPVDHANLAGCDLRRCDLQAVDLWRTNLGRARLDDADLSGADADDVAAANVRAPRARFARAKLRDAMLAGAVLDDAVLVEANLTRANLDGASLQRADLRHATLDRASLRDTDLRGANGDEASFADLDLRTVRFDGLTVRGADLSHVELSGTVADGLCAERALFHRALLTGARWTNARLRGANFFEAGLADVDWEGADLRDCDFRNASFHLGSSRSGLVPSSIPGEGSRTGFYTDESLEQSFQVPEDVRKANLRGADLRGADLRHCDFYLVDVRGARLDEPQHAWLARCRAILDPPDGSR